MEASSGVSPHDAMSAAAAAVVNPSRPKPSHRFAPGEQTVDAIGRNLFGEVAL
jgi:hypothetical protein